jgi:hypothetical protein
MTLSLSRRGFIGRVFGTTVAPSILMPITQRPAVESSLADSMFPPTEITPTDPRYQAKVMGFNQRFVGAPKYIQICGATDQVLKTVQRAVDENLRITIRGGGHCYEGFASDNPGGVIIDLSSMRKVYRDPDTNGAFCVEGGCTLWNVYTQLYDEYGVTIPAGSCYSIGVGGHVCGGGYGLLSRKHGLTVDHLYAIEVVCVDANDRASVVKAFWNDPDVKRRKLFWGHTGGGGGNFGVITRYWFSPSIPQAPETAYLSSVAWDWSSVSEGAFATLLSNYGQFFSSRSGVDDPYRDLSSVLSLPHVSAHQIVLTTQFVGNDVRLLEDFIAFISKGVGAPRPALHPLGCHPVIRQSDPYRLMPWIQAMQTLNEAGPNRRGKYKSAYMKAPFPERQITAIWRALTDHNYQNPQARLQVDSYGCQINAVSPSSTAVAHRSSIMKLQYQTYWTDPRLDVCHLDWIRRFYTDVYADTDGAPRPNSVTDGCYVNYCDMDLIDWPTLYYKENYSDLAAVKALWDPSNKFHHAQSIRLP